MQCGIWAYTFIAAASALASFALFFDVCRQKLLNRRPQRTQRRLVACEPVAVRPRAFVRGDSCESVSNRPPLRSSAPLRRGRSVWNDWKHRNSLPDSHLDDRYVSVVPRRRESSFSVLLCK